MALPAENLARAYGQTQPLRLTEGITHRQLASVLRDAANEANGIALAHAGTLTGARAKSIKVALNDVSDELWRGTGRITQAGIYYQGQLAADQSLDLDFLQGLPSGSIQQMTQAMHYEASQAADDIISHRTNGFSLKDRIYANGVVSTKQVGKIVDRHLALQSSARELAKEVKGFYAPNVPGGASYASMRLARTEINNAHHDTTIRLARDKPWVLGFQWNLSGSHPKPDACNEYADHNGTGSYDKGDVPSKPHPQCLCYLTHVMESDERFASNLISGEYDDYLSSVNVSPAPRSSQPGRKPTSEMINRTNQINEAIRATDKALDTNYSTPEVQKPINHGRIVQ